MTLFVGFILFLVFVLVGILLYRRSFRLSGILIILFALIFLSWAFWTDTEISNESETFEPAATQLPTVP